MGREQASHGGLTGQGIPTKAAVATESISKKAMFGRKNPSRKEGSDATES